MYYVNNKILFIYKYEYNSKQINKIIDKNIDEIIDTKKNSKIKFDIAKGRIITII